MVLDNQEPSPFFRAERIVNESGTVPHLAGETTDSLHFGILMLSLLRSFRIATKLPIRSASTALSSSVDVLSEDFKVAVFTRFYSG